MTADIFTEREAVIDNLNIQTNQELLLLLESQIWTCHRKYIKTVRLKEMKMEKEMQYVVVIEKTEKNYGAYVPDLPGCVAVAETKSEVRKMISEAIQFHLEGLREEGSPIPQPTSTSEIVEV